MYLIFIAGDSFLRFQNIIKNPIMFFHKLQLFKSYKFIQEFHFSQFHGRSLTMKDSHIIPIIIRLLLDYRRVKLEKRKRINEKIHFSGLHKAKHFDGVFF